MTAELPPLTSAPTTLARTLVPTHPLVAPPDPRSPAEPMTLVSWLQEGYGDFSFGAGEGPISLSPPGQTAPPAGPAPHLLVRFVHLPDSHITDDESPNRMCSADIPSGPTAGAFRPQESDECRVLDAAVRTINFLNHQTPISFVLTGGDNSDDAQTNEVRWFMQIMDGAPTVKCDSGKMNDPVAGANNDGKDPFEAVGLDMPWWWVTGNHDVLVQGNFPVTELQKQNAIGVKPILGTRDYSQPGGPVTTQLVPADRERMPLTRSELMRLVAADGDGHGLGASQVSSGKAFYSFDVAGTSLRFIILDTGTETGSDSGILRRGDVDGILRPMFDLAMRDGKLVVIASHHPARDLADGSGFGGAQQPDALTAQEWIDFLGGYDNVLFSMVGHTHQNGIRYVASSTGHAYWEVATNGVVDYPNQFRVVEVWDDDNGWLRLRTVMVDYATDGDAVAQAAKRLEVADYISGWAPDGSGTAAERNVELHIPKPM